MANEENLKKGKGTQFRSGEEAARNGAKGGIASGVSRKRNAGIKKRLQEALGVEVSSKTVKKMLKNMGMDPEDATNYDAFVASLLMKAIVLHDTTAMRMVMDYTGESPDEKRKAEEAKRKREQYKFRKEAVKAALKQREEVENSDDGFLEALAAASKEDWEDDDDGSTED